MSSVRQSAVLPAGCQPWNGETLATCGHRFAYCSTQAVYIYEMAPPRSEFVLSSVMSEHRRTITSLAWHPSRADVIATTGADATVVVWDVREQRVLARLSDVDLPSGCQPRSVAWSPHDADLLSFLNGRGPLMTWRVGQAAGRAPSVLKETQAVSSANVSRYRWHPFLRGRLVFGHGDGTVSLHSPGRKTHRHLPLGEDGEAEESDPVLGLEWDRLACGDADASCLLACSPASGVCLLSAGVERLSVLMRFRLPGGAAQVQGLAWLPSAPGLFVAADSRHGLLRLFNVSQPQPLETFRLKQTGFRALQVVPAASRGQEETGGSAATVIPPAHAVCAFLDGGVGVYDLQRARWLFLRDMGHIETIFDCQFCPRQPNLLATASFDGSIKVWDVRDMTAVVSSPGNESIIYSLAWCPHPGKNEHLLTACTSKNGVLLFDTKKGVFVKRFEEHKAAVFGVAWSPIAEDEIASVGADGLCVVRSSTGRAVFSFSHPKQVFGVEWSPFHRNMLATGGDDALVRILDVSNPGAAAAQLLKGHTAKVFHVRFSPMKEDFLCSSSDDKTVRVWDTVTGACRCVLQGHTGPVRGLVWHWELPYLVASGSWDASLRLWDVRDGACIESMLDHGADIYGLSWHRERPFLLATSSRDSTLRLWSVADMAGAAAIAPLVGSDGDAFLGCPPDSGLAVGAAARLCGPASSSLRRRRPHDDAQHQVDFLRLLQGSPHLDNLWDLARCLQGEEESFLSTDYVKGVVHLRHLLKHKRADATVSEMGRQSRTAREEQQLALAHRFLLGGQLRRHCELLVRAGKWERALAMAPGVSLAYWRHLADRHSQQLSRSVPGSGAAFGLVCGRGDRSVHELQESGLREEALCVAQALAEGCYSLCDDEEEDGVADGGHEDVRSREVGQRLAGEVCAEEAELLLTRGCPVQAACCHLAMSDVEGAVSKLLRGNELVLAAWLAQTFSKSALADCALQYLLRRCDKMVVRQFGVSLMQHCQPDAREFALVCFCARQDGSTSEIDALHHTAGFPSMAQCLEKAEQLSKREGARSEEIVKLFLLSSKPELALEIGLEEVRRRLAGADWRAKDVVRLLWLAASVRPSRLRRKECREVVGQLQVVCAGVGAAMATVRKYDAVVVPLLRAAVRLSTQTPVKELPEKELAEDLRVFTKQVIEKKPLAEAEASLWRRLERRGDCGGFVFPRGLEKGEEFVSGSGLPAHSDVNLSVFSSTRVRGPAFFLGDGRSAVSLNEALMWAKVNPFSPLGGGDVINPF